MKKSFLEGIYSQKTINDMQKKIDYLGTNNKYNAITLLNLRIFTSLIIFFVVLYISDFGYIFAPIISFLSFIFFKKIFLDTKIKKSKVRLHLTFFILVSHTAYRHLRRWLPSLRQNALCSRYRHEAPNSRMTPTHEACQ